MQAIWGNSPGRNGIPSASERNCYGNVPTHTGRQACLSVEFHKSIGTDALSLSRRVSLSRSTRNNWEAAFPPLVFQGETRADSTMTKAELIARIAEKAGFEHKKDADKALSATLEALREALVAGDNITLTGFGTFKVVDRAARKCRNPRTKAPMVIPACKVAKFIAGKQLKEAIQN